MTTESEKFLNQWIVDFLDKPEPLLNNLSPCPYARSAKILFVETTDYAQSVNQCVDTWNNKYDVVCFVCGEVDPEKFALDVRCLNDYCMPYGFVCLEDHKDIPEPLYHLDFRNGRYNIILVQKLEKINDASKKLMTAGYYKNWTTNLYNNVVAWRSGGA